MVLHGPLADPMQPAQDCRCDCCLAPCFWPCKRGHKITACLASWSRMPCRCGGGGTSSSLLLCVQVVETGRMVNVTCQGLTGMYDTSCGSIAIRFGMDGQVGWLSPCDAFVPAGGLHHCHLLYSRQILVTWPPMPQLFDLALHAGRGAAEYVCCTQVCPGGHPTSTAAPLKFI